MGRLLRDPLLHFSLLGAALFGVFLLLADDNTSDTLIVVSAAQQQQLAAAFARTWRNAPDDNELDQLIEDWVREEIANREALAMGLADNDLIVRRRLRQKYEAFMEQVAAQDQPDEEILRSWYAENRERYRSDARYSLSQRFFSADRRDDAEADAAQALAALAEAGGEPDPELGDALALPQRFSDTRAAELGNRFGDAFAGALGDLPPGRWAGPVPSAYGYHLVRVEEAVPARLPDLDEVREAVLRDWRDAQLREAREALYAQLRQRYRVRVEPLPAG